MKKDIENLDGIKLLVDEFYKLVRHDDLLAPIFQARITGDWQPHMNTMYRFWNASLLGVREYVGNPLAKHTGLPIDASHYEKWMALFFKTIDHFFEGAVADEAKRKARLMANTFYGSMNDGDPIPLHPLPKI
jgi:hemoglobin